MRAGFTFVPEAPPPTSGAGIVDPVGSWTIVGNLVLGQDGKQIMATSSDGLINAALQALPGGLALPYAVELIASECQPNGNSTAAPGFPFVGVALANGTTAGTSVAQTLMRYAGSYGVSVEGDTLATNARALEGYADNAAPNFAGANGLHLRLVNDGTRFWAETSNDGTHWSPWSAGVQIATVPNPFTHYGFVIGSNSGGHGSAVISSVKVRPLVSASVVAGSWNAGTNEGTFQLSQDIGLVTGDSIAMQGVAAATGTPPSSSGAPLFACTRIDATHIKVPNLPAFTLATGGLVVDLTR